MSWLIGLNDKRRYKKMVKFLVALNVKGDYMSLSCIKHALNSVLELKYMNFYHL